MPDDVITGDEVRQIKANPVYLIIKGNFVIGYPKFFSLKSGYRIGHSIDVGEDGSQFEHVSISRRGQIPDPAEEDCIALAILGPGYVMSEPYGGVAQYSKPLTGGDKVEKNVVRGRRIEVR